MLGASGAVGTVALQVIKRLNHVSLKGITGWSNAKALENIANKFKPEYVAASPKIAKSLTLPAGTGFLSGNEGMKALVSLQEVDLVFCAISGFAALPVVLEALRHGKKVAIANKEVLVAAGELVMKAAEKNGGTIIPVDSEHSAIFQCLQNNSTSCIKRLIITGSGGPLLNTPADTLSSVTIEQALAHPTWKMGQKITIDSATLMNKGLELIEARWLFDIDHSRIEVLIQPEAIIHSMVEFCDGAVMALMSQPDMTLPVQYALTYPERYDSTVSTINFAKMGQLNFMEPDRKRFPCLELAEAALKDGGTMQTVLNAANEVAVARFLSGSMAFTDIYKVVAKSMNMHKNCPADSLEAVIAADDWARKTALEV